MKKTAEEGWEFTLKFAHDQCKVWQIYGKFDGPVSWTLEYVSDWFATPKIFEEFDNDDGDEIISG